MKYDFLGGFHSDYKSLTRAERDLFQQGVEKINQAFRQRSGKALPKWPANLRIKRVRGAAGVWEMTWSFSGPDGRATFDFTGTVQEPILRWRRIGNHSILRKP